MKEFNAVAWQLLLGGHSASYVTDRLDRRT